MEVCFFASFLGFWVDLFFSYFSFCPLSPCPYPYHFVRAPERSGFCSILPKVHAKPVASRRLKIGASSLCSFRVGTSPGVVELFEILFLSSPVVLMYLSLFSTPLPTKSPHPHVQSKTAEVTDPLHPISLSFRSIFVPLEAPHRCAPP